MSVKGLNLEGELKTLRRLIHGHAALTGEGASGTPSPARPDPR